MSLIGKFGICGRDCRTTGSAHVSSPRFPGEAIASYPPSTTRTNTHCDLRQPIGRDGHHRALSDHGYLEQVAARFERDREAAILIRDQVRRLGAAISEADDQIARERRTRAD